MNINWKNAASGRSEAMYTDAKGFRYVLIASVGGDYSVNKLLIKSPHVLPKYSRPVIIGMGWKSDLDEAAGAYKDIDVVMEEQKDLVDILVKLEPLAVVNG